MEWLVQRVANAVVDELNIPVVSGMYIENPGLDVCKAKAIVVRNYQIQLQVCVRHYL